ncbi:PfkB family carbohydrate kinase [Paenibacillus sonchi]|uniref:PfkB family carbohydrate kinase n=1 Tax=Paenibacillus sonchi TaxID=373687 RepID=UPI001E497EC1|nr:PfkB family carbohydrate kinase [Paenibacillus sonchi]MCE3199484.1 GH32 C-terminal domain-containing protein [Paenibacillus sonchi]
MVDITAIGEVLIDFTPAGLSEKGEQLFECNPGGAPANVVVVLAKLGKSTAFIGKVGEDQFGEYLTQVLRENGVSTKGLVKESRAKTTLAFVHLREDGDRSFSFYRNPGADMLLGIDDIDLEQIKGTKIFHFGSVSMTHEPSASATLKACVQAKENGALISFDPNLRPALWQDLEQAKTKIKEGLALADIVKISEEELPFITGLTDLEEGTRQIQTQFKVKVVLVTKAEKGCFIRFGPGSKWADVPGYKVDTVDTTGAGDAFLGGFLYQLLERGGSIEQIRAQDWIPIVSFANAVGALVTTRKGAIPAIPTYQQAATLVQSAGADYSKESYRPQFHYSPPAMWLNDPNGMVYFEGEYHLMYQHHPESTVWGPMHWGHAVSKDLVNWETLPVAMSPDHNGAIFSGSALVDWKDTSGFFDGGAGLVAIFTHADIYPGSDRPRQRQSLAYSKDKGRSWSFYAGNPVLSDVEITDFRDPKVFWMEEAGVWVMVLACGDHIRFYRSANLKDWDFASEFGKSEGSHYGVWECPDLFELSVDGSNLKKWVLLVSIGDNPDYPEGSKTQYFIGSFDGWEFVNENTPDTVLWMDEGRDNYAAVSWSDIPEEDGRRVIIGWMSNWSYAKQIPTGSWRGAMTLPRVLSLTSRNGSVVLSQMPVQEIEQLRKESLSWSDLSVTREAPFIHGTNDDLLEIEVDLDIRSGDEVQIKLRSSGQSETIIGYDPEREWLFIDRSQSGLTDFNPSFACKHGARLAPENGSIKLRIWLDRSVVEVFANEGLVALTDQIFPDEPIDTVWISAETGKAELHSLYIHTLHSIHMLHGSIGQISRRVHV